ncbi:MAG: TRAP transporter small permease subunit [Gammaproteobacteria bacterium]|nr:MAG: TRAP transporter small permease subunit [Gammaproteobacteria bacterium]
MQRYLFLIDRISEWSGKAFAWLIVVLTVAVSYDVMARYLFRAPTDWAYDAAYILYGSLFLMAGAYTLSRNGHVRGDVLYGFFPPRVQAGLDLALYFLFFIPGIAALAYAGIDFARISWSLNEHSSTMSGGPPLYHFKTLIPIAGALVLLQGIAEIVRAVQCLKTGEWPKRAHDVEEVDVEELKKMVKVEEGEELRFTESELADLRKQALEGEKGEKK